MDSIKAKVVYTGKSIVENAYLSFEGQTITGISKTKKGSLLGKFAVLTPAFIDPHSHIGMHRAGEPSNESESNENMNSLLTLPDATDVCYSEQTWYFHPRLIRRHDGRK